jgi:hypothetical protein
MTFDRFARAELESFFRRREELGKFYCGTCLAMQLTRRGARKVSEAAWTAAIEEAFVRPGLLQVRSVRACEICKKPGLSIGVDSAKSQAGDQEVVIQ